MQNFDEILAESDGVMVARGDLGIEIPAPKVFVAQKLMIAKCNLEGKPVICATQMLESMVTNPRPTRAEVSDVANAVTDGADAVMLSGETAKGLWPEAAIRTMSGVVREAEATMVGEEWHRYDPQIIMPKPCSSVESICAAATRACRDQQASMLMVVTETGRVARLAAKYRPHNLPIVACCPTEQTARSCALLRGVIPIVVPWHAGTSEFSTISIHKVIGKALATVKDMGLVTRGKALVLHDSNISNGKGMQDWVLRLVDVGAKDSTEAPWNYQVHS